MALFTKTELSKKNLAELKALAKEHDIEVEKGWKATDLREALLEVEEPVLDDELEEELDNELDDEEEELDDEVLDEEVLEEDDIEPELEPAKKTRTKSTKAKVEKSGDTLAAKQVAAILGTEAKTLRQFFRSPASTVEAVGSGGRYEFAKEDVDQIKAEFDAWKTQHASRGSKRASGKSSKPAEEVEEVEEIEELDLEEELDDELDDEELELED